MTDEHTLSGIWRSHYSYPSSSRSGEFENEHLVRLRQTSNQLVVESVAKPDKSYLIMRLSINGNVATGTWQEETEPEGYYQGAIYQGAIQLVISADGKHMAGKWVGSGKDMEVNVGPWELTYVDDDLPGAGAA